MNMEVLSSNTIFTLPRDRRRASPSRPLPIRYVETITSSTIATQSHYERGPRTHSLCRRVSNILDSLLSCCLLCSPGVRRSDRAVPSWPMFDVTSLGRAPPRLTTTSKQLRSHVYTTPSVATKNTRCTPLPHADLRDLSLPPTHPSEQHTSTHRPCAEQQAHHHPTCRTYVMTRYNLLAEPC